MSKGDNRRPGKVVVSCDKGHAMLDQKGRCTQLEKEGPAASPKTTLTDGSPVTDDHREIDSATGQQKGYVVLSAEERAKGFVRPVRQSYIHQVCGKTTTMGLALAETYARDPKFYDGTFCCHCGAHFVVGEAGDFIWADGSGQKVGT